MRKIKLIGHSGDKSAKNRQVFHLQSRSHPGRTQICVIDLQLQEIQLIPIVKDNTQFAKKIIKRPLLIPEKIKQRINFMKIHLGPFYDQKFIFYFIDVRSRPCLSYFFSVDLKDLEREEFGFEFISNNYFGRLILGKFDVSMVRHDRVSCKNLSIFESRDSQVKGTATYTGERRHVNLIGQIIDPSRLPEIALSEEYSRPQRPFRLLFFLDVDPRKDKFYEGGRILAQDPRIDLTGAPLADTILKQPIPLRGSHNQFTNSKGRNNKTVAFVHQLENLDLVLIVYDLSNRKILKKGYIFFKEILSGLGLISRLFISRASIEKYILNPFKSTLHFSLSIYPESFDDTSQQDVAERQRLIDLGYDVSNLTQNHDQQHARLTSKKCLFVEVSNCFNQKKRTVKARAFDPSLFKYFLSQDSLITSIVDKKVEISISELRGPKEAKISLDYENLDLGKVEILKDLDDKHLLISTKSQAIIVDRETLEVIENQIFEFSTGRQPLINFWSIHKYGDNN